MLSLNQNTALYGGLLAVASTAVAYKCFLSTSARLRNLLSPYRLSEAIEEIYTGVKVKAVDIVKIHPCGDGLASTTDRIILRAKFFPDGNQPVLPPEQMLAKIILLNSLMRMGASFPVIRAAGNFARFLESSPIPGLRQLSKLIWASIVLYQRYFPHAPDAMYQTESRIYRQLHRELAAHGVHSPACYGVIIDEPSSTFGVLIEDLSLRGAEFPNALRSSSLEVVQALLRTLARLHAAFWDSPRLGPGGDLHWVATHLDGGMQPVFSAIGLGLIEDQVARHPFKADLIKPLGRSVKELFRAVRVAQELLTTDTPTLCHGDTHIANTFLFNSKRCSATTTTNKTTTTATTATTSAGIESAEGEASIAAGLFDFQLCIRGSCMHDVTYAIITSMSPDARRIHERDLVSFYLKELGMLLKSPIPRAISTTSSSSSSPPPPPTFEQAWQRYRQTAIWGLVIGWLICPPVNYGEAITYANIERMAQACSDLHTLEALGL